MQLTIQTALLNVSDLDRSIEFYRDVLELMPVSQGDRVAALMVSETERRQVLVLREVGAKAFHPGRGGLGLRMLSLEAGSLEELDVIEHRMAERQVLLGRLETEKYRVIHGLDPDRIELSVASSLTGGPIQSEDWHHLDDSVYALGE
jgi:catechol 2,3-dioxygenase-like lactoylglutathione lyase family enzyme